MCVQLLEECYFQEVEKIKTIGSSYMAASGLSPDRQVSPAVTLRLYEMLHSSLMMCVFVSLQESEDSWNHLSELVLFALAMQESLKHVNIQTGNQFQLRIGMKHTHTFRINVNNLHTHTHTFIMHTNL